MDKYILVIGGCGWDCTYNQKNDGSYDSVPNYEAPGSKGSNQAVGVAKAGANCKIITAIGSDIYATKIKNNLENYNIDTTHILQVQNSNSDRCDIYVDLNGNNKMSRAPGSIQYITKEIINDNIDLIKNASCVVFQSKIDRNAYVQLIEICYKYHIPTVLTPSPFEPLKLMGESAQINLELLKKVTYITANKNEALGITGANDIEEAMKILNNLIITAGPRGVYFIDEDKKLVNSPSLKPKNIVDKTGAGDTFCAFFAAGLYYHDMNIFNAVELGIKASTLKLEGEGAQSSIPTLSCVLEKEFELDIQSDCDDNPDID